MTHKIQVEDNNLS